MNTCKHCNKSSLDLNLDPSLKQQFSNHVRWCQSNERGIRKFISLCSCIICKKELTIQNLHSHSQTHFKSVKSECIQCNEPIYSNNKFCSQSCAGTYNNIHRNPLSKRGPSKGTPSNRIKICYTKIQVCPICRKYHTRKGKSCSLICQRILLSKSIRLAIQNGHCPNKNRGRGKKSYLETSFDSWLKQYYSGQYHIEHPFKRFDVLKTYFADFYFPDKNLIIELDGTQHKKTIEYDQDRDLYISTTYGINIIRISHNEYVTKTKIDLVKSVLNIN